MITIGEILDEINLKLVKEFPNTVIYLDPERDDFERPSFLLEYLTTVQEDINFSTVSREMYFSITGFFPTGNYFEQRQMELIEAQQKILDLFRFGVLTVGHRCLKIQATEAGRYGGEFTVDLKLEFFDDREEKQNQTHIEIMKKVNTKVKEVK